MATPLKNGAPGCNCCGDTCHATLCVSTILCPCFRQYAGYPPPNPPLSTLRITGPGGAWAETDPEGTGTYNPHTFYSYRCITIDPINFGEYLASGSDGYGNTDEQSITISACGSYSLTLDYSHGWNVPSTGTLTLPDGSTLTMTRAPGDNLFRASDEWTKPYDSLPTAFTYLYDWCTAGLSVCTARASGAGGGGTSYSDGIGNSGTPPDQACEHPVAVSVTLPNPADPTSGISLCGPGQGGGYTRADLGARFGPVPWVFLFDG
jgi:hypothetical protein